MEKTRSVQIIQFDSECRVQDIKDYDIETIINKDGRCSKAFSSGIADAIKNSSYCSIDQIC